MKVHLPTVDASGLKRPQPLKEVKEGGKKIMSCSKFVSVALTGQQRNVNDFDDEKNLQILP
jgi:hypothetical protein